MPLEYLYAVIEDVSEDNCAFKVGYTNDVEKRVSRLQTGNPRPIRCYRAILMPDAQKYEQVLRRVLRVYASKGRYPKTGAREWFYVDDTRRVINALYDIIQNAVNRGCPVWDIEVGLRQILSRVVVNQITFEEAVSNYWFWPNSVLSTRPAQLYRKSSFKTAYDRRRERRRERRRSRGKN